MVRGRGRGRGASSSSQRIKSSILLDALEKAVQASTSKIDSDDELISSIIPLKRRKSEEPVRPSPISASPSVSNDRKVEPEVDLLNKNVENTENKNVETQVETKRKRTIKPIKPAVPIQKRTRRRASKITPANVPMSTMEDSKGASGGSGGTGECKDGPSFKDIGGMKRVLNELTNDILFPLCNPELPKHLGVKPISGVLLHGPPGCGKTKLAHAIANEAGMSFYSMSAADVVTGALGVSERNILNLFARARTTAPSIVFIDEIDAIASKRGPPNMLGTEKRIVTQLLTCMGEAYQAQGSRDVLTGSPTTSGKKPGYVLVIGATNRPEAIDPAFRRPGRFDREIALGVPDESARAEILSVLSRDLRLETDCNFDLAKIARATPGFVGADLSALIDKAGNLAMRRIADSRTANTENTNVTWWKQPWEPGEMERLSISMDDFEDAVKLIQPSTTREGFTASPNVKWEDVGGLESLRKELNLYIVSRITHPDEFEEFGVDLEQGFLLYGPPGCGKTLIAKAVATEAGANFIHIKGPELLNKWVGESELAVRTVFRRARTSSPCILFIDEVDAIARRRGTECGNLVVERVLTQLLIELDGADKRRGVFVIGATNRPEVMDEAIKRPGRLGKHMYVPLPGPEERGLILKALARNKPISEDVDLAALGWEKAYENLSGADLASVVNEAAMIALVEKRMSCETRSFETKKWMINKTHFDRAVEKITPSVSEKVPLIRRFVMYMNLTFFVINMSVRSFS
ncbi:hypothetical protein MKW94_002327 [Papaver nudicaule]|uniref:AAA+ ATPase domain-containing protein n=1 Tax=Papaver nudicaule TaxID=74823 RepID=A0AA41VYE3_PAPNU|nr:hypothetical protein [Papaver nudicaule]